LSKFPHFKDVTVDGLVLPFTPHWLVRLPVN
jgi:hypothetical protein